MIDGEKVNIEIVEIWFHRTCTCKWMKVNDETSSSNYKLMQVCVWNGKCLHLQHNVNLIKVNWNCIFF
jgi:hypothetical protein